MSFDAITGIAQAEDAAKVAVQYAEAQARKLAADAGEAGKAAVEAAVKKAETELEELNRQSLEKAAADVGKASGKTETKKAVLRAAAEARLDRAAAMIQERIVNG